MMQPAQVGNASDHYLLFTRRDGQGTLWINSTLTDEPYISPLLMQKTGVQELVPGITNVPLAQVRHKYIHVHASASHYSLGPFFLFLHRQNQMDFVTASVWEQERLTQHVGVSSCGSWHPQVSGVFNATQLVTLLQNPPAPYLVLLYSTKIDDGALQVRVHATSPCRRGFC